MDANPRCGSCGVPLGPFESITLSGEGTRCYPCFNRAMADRRGVAFDHATFEPVVRPDADGVPHTLTVRSLLVATGHEMEALEIRRDGRVGYHFRVLGEADADAWELFQRLHNVMRHAMAVRHVTRTEFGWQLTTDQCVVGRIEHDPDANGVPRLVVDGKSFRWDEVGRMLMTFEGFTLVARVEDTIEVVGRAQGDGPVR